MEMWPFVLAFLLLVTATECQNMRKSAPREDDCGIQQNPPLYGMLSVGRPVYGVQPIGDEIYVIRDSTPYIEVYDRYTFQPKRKITVPGMQGPYDMVQSNKGQTFLFIADWFNSSYLFRVQVPQGTVSSFSTGEIFNTTLGLAGNNAYTDGNILVTSSISQTVKKFDVSGNMIRKIAIPAIHAPRQSIQTRPDRYAVCYGYGPPPKPHLVCPFNASGVIGQCYDGQLTTPGRLELAKNDCILVADTGNQRVVLLNKNLEYVRDLIYFDGVSPYRLFIDKTQNLLFVALNKVNGSGIAVSGLASAYLL